MVAGLTLSCCWKSQGLLRRRRLLDSSRISTKDALSSLVCLAMNPSRLMPSTASAARLGSAWGCCRLHKRYAGGQLKKHGSCKCCPLQEVTSKASCHSWCAELCVVLLHSLTGLPGKALAAADAASAAVMLHQ